VRVCCLICEITPGVWCLGSFYFRTKNGKKVMPFLFFLLLYFWNLICNKLWLRTFEFELTPGVWCLRSFFNPSTINNHQQSNSPNNPFFNLFLNFLFCPTFLHYRLVFRSKKLLKPNWKLVFFKVLMFIPIMGTLL
jgi:hypothetical protein